jgi:hypothetical protein
VASSARKISVARQKGVRQREDSEERCFASQRAGAYGARTIDEYASARHARKCAYRYHHAAFTFIIIAVRASSLIDAADIFAMLLADAPDAASLPLPPPCRFFRCRLADAAYGAARRHDAAVTLKAAFTPAAISAAMPRCHFATLL